ncbi:hypothetical protein COU17_03355 [Candidatus Kaiserbacteria bacterium CG10_big_fil_rev_8_21_14_0_10_49_17]|uniref:Methyltransferase type 11 domain-containing protein n=1 Tax=Candidatus Kaiserbacteria bacterium CG10_big_fil_rev_8_21_14_0_10_49_17 TaxID=1974609 RepID=A0A2M6WDW8_9BACT|nr:MAG: hypothetical protein COU17_03355 [Candidatus Kaiserbacteria bacterium CG10_big_fil_rev_8_21_14_0_10_49_17]
MNKVKQIALKGIYATGLMNKMSREGFDAIVEKYATDKKTLDIASGGNPYAAFFPNRIAADIAEHPGVDVVVDVHNLSTKFKPESFDVVLCTEALEHFYNPWSAMEEMKKVLRRGGVLILSTRFIFPLHEVPHDYYRFTEYGLRYLLRDMEILDMHASGGTMHTLAVLYQRIGYQCRTLGVAPLKLLWFIASKITALLSCMLTREYGDVGSTKPVPRIMASGYIVVARKK